MEHHTDDDGEEEHLPSEDTQYGKPGRDNDHSGTARDSSNNKDGGAEERGGPLKVERLIERFNDLKYQELKPRTKQTYIYVFKNFAKYINLETVDKLDDMQIF